MKTCTHILLLAGTALVLASCSSTRSVQSPLGSAAISSRMQAQAPTALSDIREVADNSEPELQWNTGPAMW